MAAAVNSSSAFSSMLATSKLTAAGLPPQIDYVIDTITSASPWTLLLTLFAMCVVYDQSMCLCDDSTP